MTQAAKAQEPSMEEILASIRRIIADDDNGKVKPAETTRTVQPPPTPPPLNSIPAPSFADEPETPVEDEVLDLTPAMEVQPPSGFQTVNPAGELVFQEPEPESEPPPALETPEPMPSPSPVEPAAQHLFQQADRDERSILSASAASAVDAAFNSLAQTVLVQNSQTLDGLVREMLRPMLKTWLDDNLPSLVERLVRAEIERVSRGHG